MLWFEWVAHTSKDMILHEEDDWRRIIPSPTLGLCNSRYLPYSIIDKIKWNIYFKYITSIYTVIRIW